MRITHHDKLSIRFDRETLKVNADGSRTINGFGAHVGNYTYHDDKGQPFIEHVPASTLFSSRSLDSAAGSTLTIRHGPGLVTPDRFREEAHGSWVRAWDAGDGNLGVTLRVGSRDALDFIDDAIDKGDAVELSPVYEVDVVPGQDPAARAEFGRADATQRDRLYSGIALLGPNEARGGPGTRLQLDGPQCAPENTRIEIARVSLDSAPTERVHFATKSRNAMNKATISSGGRTRAVTQPQLDALRALTVNADQIETGRVVIEIEGQETDELVLPVAMIEAFLEGLGATSAPAPEAPMEEEIALESLDAGPDEEKLDAKTVRRMISDALDGRDRKRAAADARRSSINADASPLLPPGYDYNVAWTQVAVDAIVRARPDMEAAATQLAKRATSDAEAAGQLRQMLIERRLERDSEKPATGTKITHEDSAGEAWKSPTMPKAEAKQ